MRINCIRKLAWVLIYMYSTGDIFKQIVYNLSVQLRRLVNTLLKTLHKNYNCSVDYLCLCTKRKAADNIATF